MRYLCAEAEKQKGVNMTEYIKRSDAIEAIWSILSGMGYNLKHNDRLREEVDAVIGDYPDADVQPVPNGSWEERLVDDPEFDPYGFFRRRWYCSTCGRWQSHGAAKYCPNCGAKMQNSLEKVEANSKKSLEKVEG